MYVQSAREVVQSDNFMELSYFGSRKGIKTYRAIGYEPQINKKNKVSRFVKKKNTWRPASFDDVYLEVYFFLLLQRFAALNIWY